MEPGRKIAEEYRSRDRAVEHDPVENWVARADKIVPALRSSILKKTRKHYSIHPELLVYLNIDEWGIRQREIETQIANVLADDTKPFSAISVLWKGKVFSSSGEVFGSEDVGMFEED